MENNTQGRRGSPRFRINYMMKYARENDVKRFHAFFNDISEKGLKFLAKEFLPKSTPIHVELPYDSQPILLNGKVVWNDALSKDFYQVGVSFEEVSNENRECLTRYIQGLKTKIKLALILFFLLVGALTIPLEAAMHKDVNKDTVNPSAVQLNSQDAGSDIK
jgi:hypothetical protein